MTATTVHFAIPGALDTPTGGYHYDRRVIDGLRARGWTVVVLPLDPSFPSPTAQALADAQRRFAAIDDDALVLVDGLAFGAMPGLAALHAQRLRWLALVHHPLAMETGLAPARAAALHDSERRALGCARRVLVTGEFGARCLVPLGVARDRIDIAPPGTEPAPLATGSGRPGAPVLLCVATLSARKGHLLLLQALARLRERPWTLVCAGSTTLDPDTAQAVQAAATALGLDDRVQFTGALDAGAVAALYARADLFVSASLFEGWGMALAEALARGLPVVATDTGAAAELVGSDAGRVVPAGDGEALFDALAAMLGDLQLRERCAAGARRVRDRLTGWGDTADAVAASLRRALR